MYIGLGAIGLTAGKVGAAATGVAFSVPLSSAKYTISPGTVATVNAANASLENVKADTARTVGSFTMTPTIVSGACVIGAAATSVDATVADWPGDYNFSAGYQSNGNIWLGVGGAAQSQAVVATYTTGDVIKPVIVANKLCFQKNGVDVYGNSSTGVGGIDVSTWGQIRPVAALSAQGSSLSANYSGW